jgi:nucleoside phosphorylase/CheY-like chemotaxis protein
LIVAIIEDNAEKRVSIRKVVNEAAPDATIREGKSVAAAKHILRNETVDLLVLDVALPLLDDGLPTQHGGLDLLDEVGRSNRFHMPAQVVGMTALPEVLDAAVERFGRELWSVILYDRASTEWAELLSAKIRHLLRLKHVGEQEPDFDLAIITALKSPELDAVLALSWDWSPVEKAGDATHYHAGTFRRLDGSIGRVVAARAPRMGMPASAALAMKVGLLFRPRFMAMVGICAGRKGETNLGDLVAANPTWDYGSGKHAVKDGKPIFKPAPDPFPLTTHVRGIVERFEGEHEATLHVRNAFQGAKPASVPKLHIGPFASGAAVVARAAMMEEVQDQHRKLLAIDMEAFGLASAATELPRPQPDFLILKGVSDFADEEKGDSHREYAAFMSAQFLAYLCTDARLC